MDILIPVTGFGRAGGFRVLSKLADEWARAGHRPAFLAPNWSDPPYYPTVAEILWVDRWGVKRPLVPRSSSAGPAQGGVSGVARSLLALWLGIQRSGRRWDAIIANHSLTAWPVALAPVGGKKTYYVQAYEPEYYGGRPGLRGRVLQGLARGSYSLPLRQIANAPLYLGYRACRARSWVPPGLDLELFRPRAGGAGDADPARPLVVGCIGRLEPEKGTRIALDGFREFVRRHPGAARFRLADFGVPQEWFADLDLERVSPGNDAELAEYYRSLDVLLAMGTVQHGAHHYPVMEAMACGVTVVTTGYMPASPANAWIVEPAAAEAAAALAEILGSPAAVAEKRARAREAIEAYAWPEIGRRFAEELSRE